MVHDLLSAATLGNPWNGGEKVDENQLEDRQEESRELSDVM